jgi:hypothetical protein
MMMDGRRPGTVAAPERYRALLRATAGAAQTTRAG